MQDNQFDVVIVGGGMVGAALACGLTQQHFRVAVIERAEPAPFDADSDPICEFRRLAHPRWGC